MNDLLHSYNFGRVNGLYGDFAEIALNHYYSSKQIYQRLLVQTYIDETEIELYHALIHNSYIVCVFSAMAIESFLNDYLAARLGDKEYYDTFDSLSIINKVNLICKLIFKINFDKSTELYACLKQLTKCRNSLVHNKSESFYETQLYKNSFAGDAIISDGSSSWEISTEMLKEYEQTIGMAKNAINSLINIAMFFTKHDEESLAKFRLLGIGGYPQLSPCIQSILKEFNIKVY